VTDTRVRAALTTLVTLTLIVGLSAAPVMAQGAIVTYVVYVDFFHPICNLSNVQVTLDDPTGRVVATGYSPDGSIIAIIYRTTSPPDSLTVRASGQDSIGSYTWTASGISIVKIGPETDYWIWVKML
jgi:hypothetical protein